MIDHVQKLRAIWNRTYYITDDDGQWEAYKSTEEQPVYSIANDAAHEIERLIAKNKALQNIVDVLRNEILATNSTQSENGTCTQAT